MSSNSREEFSILLENRLKLLSNLCQDYLRSFKKAIKQQREFNNSFMDEEEQDLVQEDPQRALVLISSLSAYNLMKDCQALEVIRQNFDERKSLEERAQQEAEETEGSEIIAVTEISDEEEEEDSQSEAESAADGSEVAATPRKEKPQVPQPAPAKPLEESMIVDPPKARPPQDTSQPEEARSESGTPFGMGRLFDSAIGDDQSVTQVPSTFSQTVVPGDNLSMRGGDSTFSRIDVPPNASSLMPSNRTIYSNPYTDRGGGGSNQATTLLKSTVAATGIQFTVKQPPRRSQEKEFLESGNFRCLA